MHIYNGMSANDLPVVGNWTKSSFSNPTGNCVELAVLAEGAGIALRNSRDPQGPAQVFTRAEIEAFIRGAAAGDFDTFGAR